jgi:hypothetical protein
MRENSVLVLEAHFAKKQSFNLPALICGHCGGSVWPESRIARARIYGGRH